VTKSFPNVPDLLRTLDPHQPVYCIFPHVYNESTKHFLNGFPGRVLYAVKANNHPEVIKALYAAGVRHFDCASIVEIELVSRLCPDSTLYFMNPVRFEGDARTAHQQHGVRHFVIDHHSGLAPLVNEIDPEVSIIFARMAVSHASAQSDLSAKFGAQPEEIPALLKAIADSGAEAAMAFNVGTGVEDPAAYEYAIGVARDVLEQVPFKVRLLDIGGGFPKSYPGLPVPALDDYFSTTRAAAQTLSLTENGELLAEPGRALSAPGMSAVTRVLLRKSDRIYINDGLYGALWELRYKAHLRYSFRVFRNGELLGGNTQVIRVFGPTCDSGDELPAELELPTDIDVGDHIEFGSIGAYSLSGRTDFNGFYSDDIVLITDQDSRPP
jgi:ornithine decarboxylase